MSTPSPVPAAQDPESIARAVRERYGAVAREGQSCCGPTCCSANATATVVDSTALGYSADELATLPAGADLGLGCGAPLAALDLQPGETVVDLGSGAGIDALLAAAKVGASGRVIGVDMTPEMLARARANAAAAEAWNVEFREGRLEALPVVDGSVDAVTSNCVINLVPDKSKVFREIARVLRPGGRLVVSDIVLERPLPTAIAEDVLLWCGCVAGASVRGDYFAMLADAGLRDVELLRDVDYLAAIGELPAEVQAIVDRHGLDPRELAGVVRSVTYRARR